MIMPAIVYCLAVALSGQTPLPGKAPAVHVGSPSIITPAPALSAAPAESPVISEQSAGLAAVPAATPGAPRAEDAPRSMIAEAKKLYQEKKYAESLAIFQKVAGLDPKNAEAYNGIGLCYRAQGKIDLAIEAFQKAIERDPGISYFYYNLARSYGSKQQFDLAMIAYHRVIKDNPTNGLAYFELGNIYFMKKEFTKAQEHYEKAASIFGEKTPQGEQALRNAIKSEMLMQRMGK